MPLLERLNDFSWSLLEKARLAGFFEAKRIPPILFPIALIAVAILLLFLLMPSTPPELASCGDGECDPLSEDAISCPRDCFESSEKKSVIVDIRGDAGGEVEVFLDDADGALIQQMKGSERKFAFSGISASSAKATVLNPSNGKKASSDIVLLGSGTTTITIYLLSDFFEAAGGDSGQMTGTLRVIVSDAESGLPMLARVMIVMPQGSSYLSVVTKNINDVEYISVEPNKAYAAIAEAAGYDDFNSRENPVTVGAGQTRDILINMHKSEPSTAALLTACAYDQRGAAVTGFMQVYSLIGERAAEKSLIGGCTSFELAAGDSVSVSTSGLPTNCTNAEDDITIAPGENRISLAVSCGSPIGRARAKLMDSSGAIKTQNATITAWHSNGTKIIGSGPSGALALGESNYTEYASIAANIPFKFISSGLPGYLTYTSPEYTVLPGENRSITLTLPQASQQQNFTFYTTYPNPVRNSSNFTASLSRVLYGQTDVTQLADITAKIGANSCNVTRNTTITARCAAPNVPGSYDLSFFASYSGATGSKSGSISVLSTAPQGYFELIPHALLDSEPPMAMDFDIKFNGTPLDSLDGSSVAVYYVDGRIAAPGTPVLSGANGLYSMTVDTPFPGNHRASIYLMKVKGSQMYEQNFTYDFEAMLTSAKVTSERSASPRISEPSQQVRLLARIKYNNAEVANLSNVYATFRDQRVNLLWDAAQHIYTGTVSTPSYEGIFNATFLLGYQNLGFVKVYVVNTQKSQSSSCPLSNCQTLPDVRKCTYEHKYNAPPLHSEQNVISCIERGWFSGLGDIYHCMEPSANRGDWKADCKLDSSDKDAQSSFMGKVTDPQERTEYLGCGDMDNDGDVDQPDLTCLQKVASGAWFGDVGDGLCLSPMRGGFCYDIKVSSPLKGDFNDDDLITDSDIAIMDNITRDANTNGVTPPAGLLAFADFNQDGAINSADKECLEHFRDVDLPKIMQDAQQGIASTPDMPLDCLNVYNISCSGGGRGDLNGDGVMAEIDVIIAGMIATDLGYLMSSPSGLPLDAQGQAVPWSEESAITSGQTRALQVPLEFGRDWIIELEGSFDFSNRAEGGFMYDPSVDLWDSGGRLSISPYNNGQLPGQTLDVSPSFFFTLDRTSYDLTIGYRGVATEWGGMPINIEPTGNDTLRIEYLKDERKVFIYWNSRLVGHFAYEEKSLDTFNVRISSLKFGISGKFRSYVGDLSPFMTRYGSLGCADFNQDGAIDESDFLCMAVSLQGGFDGSSDFCKSCAQRGVEQGWYYPFDVCADNLDNECDTVVDVARMGSRVDANACDWCPDGQQGDKGGTWCWRGPYWDLDFGMDPGIEDGNYGVCMAHSWADTDVWGDPAAPFVKHLERSTDDHEPACTPEMQCHFTLCFDNYRICSSSGAWKQHGSGANHPTDKYSEFAQQSWGNNRDSWVQEYAPGANGTIYTQGTGPAPQYDPATDTYIDPLTGRQIDVMSGNYLNGNGNYVGAGGVEINPETGYVIDPNTGLDTSVVGTPVQMPGFANQRISADGQHYIGSECSPDRWVTMTKLDGSGNITYKTYYGPWGDFLWCEGPSPPTTSSISHCGDTWDDNCLAGPIACDCSGNSLLSCGSVGGTQCQNYGSCPSGFKTTASADCNPCCMPNNSCPIPTVTIKTTL